MLPFLISRHLYCFYYFNLDRNPIFLTGKSLCFRSVLSPLWGPIASYLEIAPFHVCLPPQETVLPSCSRFIHLCLAQRDSRYPPWNEPAVPVPRLPQRLRRDCQWRVSCHSERPARSWTVAQIALDPGQGLQDCLPLYWLVPDAVGFPIPSPSFGD